MLARIRHDSEGASAVEFALVLPVLIILLFGIMYGASLFNSQQTITQAAREGARFAATLPLSEFDDDDVDVAPPEPAWFDSVAGRAKSVMDSDRPLTHGGTAPSACVVFYYEGDSWPGGDTAACPADLSGVSGDDMARVQVITSRPARLELGIFSIGPINLQSSAIARFEGPLD